MCPDSPADFIRYSHRHGTFDCFCNLKVKPREVKKEKFYNEGAVKYFFL